MSIEQQVAELVRDGRSDEALVVLAKAVDQLQGPANEAARLQRLAQEGLEQGTEGR